MGVLATAGGEAMDGIPLLGCWCGTAGVAFVALFAAFRRSLGWSITALSAAVYQALTAWVLVAIDKPPAVPDPDELPPGWLVWRLVLWSSAGMVVAIVSLVWVLVKRRETRPPSPPNPFPDAGSPEGATGNSQG